MRCAAALVGLSLLGVGAAGADEAAIVMPTVLAARVETGRRTAVAVGLESLPDGTLVTLKP